MNASFIQEDSRTRFSQYYRFPLAHLEKAYQDEIAHYSDSRWEAPQRAARLSAAVKCYKTSEMLAFVLFVVDEQKLDCTPLVAKRLCKALFGRTGSQDTIVAVFGQKGRIAKSEDAAPEVIEKIANIYSKRATEFWSETLLTINKVKKGYSSKIKTLKKAKSK